MNYKKGLQQIREMNVAGGGCLHFLGRDIYEISYFPILIGEMK
jgi:hypothetical protein